MRLTTLVVGFFVGLTVAVVYGSMEMIERITRD